MCGRHHTTDDPTMQRFWISCIPAIGVLIRKPGTTVRSSVTRTQQAIHSNSKMHGFNQKATSKTMPIDCIINVQTLCFLHYHSVLSRKSQKHHPSPTFLSRFLLHLFAPLRSPSLRCPCLVLVTRV